MEADPSDAIARPVYPAGVTPFRRLWLAQAVSLLGDFIAVFAVQVAVTFRMHGTPRDIAGVFAAGLVPTVILSPFAGALADRWDPRRTMIASDFIRANLILLLALTSSIHQIWAISFAIACVASFFNPAFAITVPLLIPRHELPSAYARLQQSMQMMRIASPAVAAVLVGSLGERACYYADSASFLLSAALLTTLRCSCLRVPAAPPQLSAGSCFLLSDRKFSALLLALAAATFAGSCFGGLASLYVRDLLHGESGVLAMISSLIGAGTIGGAAIARRILTRFRDPLAFVCSGMTTVGVSLLMFAKLRNERTALAASLVMGAGVAAVMVAGTAILQGRTPPELRGRISGISATLTSTSQLAAMLISGSVAARIGVRGVYAASAAILFGVALALLASRIDGASKAAL